MWVAVVVGGGMEADRNAGRGLVGSRAMSDCRWAAVAVLLTGLTARPGTAVAEPLSMPSETLSAFQAFAEATQQLQKARAALVAVEAGEKPQSTSEDWAGILQGYETAAETIRRSGGPTVPDASAYGVPLDQLRSCGTRSAALAKLDRQVKLLHNTSVQASETRAYLKNRLDAAQAADETRRQLVKAAAKLAGSPLLQEVFTWSWQDLELQAAKWIASYANEIKRYQERLDRGNAELKSRAATLSGQADTFGAARDCLLAGQWMGSKSQGGNVAGLTLNLVSTGISWTGSANVDGRTVAVRSVAISGTTVSISLADGRGSMRGALSPDGRSYHGSFSSMDGPGSFSLAKQ
jgi:hypothetical protein